MKSYADFLSEAQKRIEMVRVKHGTSRAAAEKIKKSGFSGSEVHAATHSDTARGFGRRYDKNPSVITMLIPKKAIKNQPEKEANVVKTQGQRGIDSLGRRHYSVVMSPDYATSKITTTPIIQKPRIPKRFQEASDMMQQTPETSSSSNQSEIKREEQKNRSIAQAKIRTLRMQLSNTQDPELRRIVQLKIKQITQELSQKDIPLLSTDLAEASRNIERQQELERLKRNISQIENDPLERQRERERRARERQAEIRQRTIERLQSQRRVIRPS